MFDDPIAHCRRQKLNNRGMNFSRRGKRPAFLSVARDDFRNLIGELFLNAAIGFHRDLRPFRNGSPMMSARAVAHWKATGKIAHFIDQPSVRVGDVEGLY